MGADMAQLLSLLMHVFAMGHVAGPWQLQLHLDRQALQHLCDRVEDSMASSPGAWARWADMVACGGLRKGGIGFNQALIEHLPLLASLPHDLLTSLLPQPHLGSVTLKFTSAAAMLQTMLFTVLCSHSLAAVMGAAEAVVAGLTGNTAPLRRNRLPEMLQSSHTRPVLCLCDSEASSAVDNIHKLAQKEQRKVVQLSLTDLAASESKGLPGEVRGPAAQSCATPGAVLERLEECKDVGYWLVLHLQPGALRLAQAGCEAVGWQLLEWIWFNCSTPSFHSTADEKFRLFIIVDSRSPCALPTWLFRSRRGLCLFDSQTGLQLRAWLEHAVDCTRRSEQSPPVPVVPTVQAPSPSSSKAAAGKEFKNLADAANGSQLLSEGKMAKATSSPVLCSCLDMEGISVSVALLSGQSCTVVLHGHAALWEVRAEAGRQLGVGLEALIAPCGKRLDDYCSLESCEGLTLTALCRRARLVSSRFAKAFALIRGDETVVTWGDDQNGGDSSEVQHLLRRVQDVQVSDGAFCAVLADGSVVTWGQPNFGGDSRRVQSQLRKVRFVVPSYAAFAAVTAEDQVVTWGNADYGGDCSSVQQQLQNVRQVQGSYAAFAAIREESYGQRQPKEKPPNAIVAF
ncbi:unnamed protein product [Effrenium voratum]|uniref:Uncharacterized protein n=1 Tax=Effrenium voratum TaxID=2562239 RepID=A0AA36IJV3_9DINO|nr:unnamed protein product [Effrenium voratum]